MSEMDVILRVAGFALLMCCSVGIGGMFCGMETGIYVLNKVRLDLRAEKGAASARRLQRLLKNPHNMLATILVGTNISGYITTFCASTIFLTLGAGTNTQWYTIALTTPIMFVFAESVPKNVFRQLTERITYRRAWFLAAASRLFNAVGINPLVRGFSGLLTLLVRNRKRDTLSSASLATVLAESQATGLLTHSQLAMADRVMRIADVTVQQAMIPIDQVISAPVDVTRPQLEELFAEHNVSRIPLTDPQGQVVGILDMYRVLAQSEADQPAEKMTPVLRFDRRRTVNEALFRMQSRKAVMAVVVDAENEQAGPIGIITLKDLAEQIVGDLEAW
ncbi:MAG: CNNM domain-containing protein [Phycisphaerae bacterium]